MIISIGIEIENNLVDYKSLKYIKSESSFSISIPIQSNFVTLIKRQIYVIYVTYRKRDIHKSYQDVIKYRQC